MAYPTWSGVFPAATTQFRKDLSVDLNATAQHLDTLVQSGISGLVMLGSLGENTALNDTEKLDVVRVAKEVANGKIPVVSGIAELSTGAAVERIKQMEKAGVDGFMPMPAMAFRPDRQEAIAHFRTVSQATELPIILYNNPISYHADVLPDMMAELAEQTNIIAIKESSGDTRRVTDLINVCGDRFTIFAGVDDLALECAMLGAKGWIAGIGLAFPIENQKLWDLAMAGKWKEALDIYRWYTPLLHLDVGTKFVQNIKLAIQEVGLGSEWVRLPRLPLEGQARESVLAIIRKGIENRPA